MFKKKEKYALIVLASPFYFITERTCFGKLATSDSQCFLPNGHAIRSTCFFGAISCSVFFIIVPHKFHEIFVICFVLHSLYLNILIPYVAQTTLSSLKSFAPLHSFLFLLNSHEGLYIWYARLKSSLQRQFSVLDFLTSTPCFFFSLSMQMSYTSKTVFFSNTLQLSINFLRSFSLQMFIQMIIFKIYVVKILLYCCSNTWLTTC